MNSPISALAAHGPGAVRSPEGGRRSARRIGSHRGRPGRPRPRRSPSDTGVERAPVRRRTRTAVHACHPSPPGRRGEAFPRPTAQPLPPAPQQKRTSGSRRRALAAGHEPAANCPDFWALGERRSPETWQVAHSSHLRSWKGPMGSVTGADLGDRRRLLSTQSGTRNGLARRSPASGPPLPTVL